MSVLLRRPTLPRKTSERLGTAQPDEPGGVPGHRRPVALLHARVPPDHVWGPFGRSGRAVLRDAASPPCQTAPVPPPRSEGGRSAPGTRETGTRIPPWDDSAAGAPTTKPTQTSQEHLAPRSRAESRPLPNGTVLPGV